MLFESLRKSRFWIEWQRKFENNADSVWIVPNNRKVSGVRKKAISNSSRTPKQKANDIWRWVYNNIDYQLRKKWQEPEVLIASGSGDCEDISFLIASVLHGSGVQQSKIGIGYILGPQGRQEPHVWNVVDGQIVDGTLPPDFEGEISYKVIEEYTIKNKDNGQSITP